MGWEETIIIPKECEGCEVDAHVCPYIHCKNYWRLEQPKAQAKTSFEQGDKNGYDRGIRTVVEWIEENNIFDKVESPTCQIGVFQSSWQAFLKEQGVE